MPEDMTTQNPAPETPQYVSPESEHSTPWTPPEAAGTEESEAAPEAASSEMPASEDPNKITIPESDLNSSGPTEADAEKKIDLMDSFSAPTSEANNDSTPAPQDTSGDRIDLSNSFGAPSENNAAPESPAAPEASAEPAENSTPAPEAPMSFDNTQSTETEAEKAPEATPVDAVLGIVKAMNLSESQMQELVQGLNKNAE